MVWNMSGVLTSVLYSSAAPFVQIAHEENCPLAVNSGDHARSIKEEDRLPMRSSFPVRSVPPALSTAMGQEGGTGALWKAAEGDKRETKRPAQFLAQPPHFGVPQRFVRREWWGGLESVGGWKLPPPVFAHLQQPLLPARSFMQQATTSSLSTVGGS